MYDDSPNNSPEYCVNLQMELCYDYGSSYDCKCCGTRDDDDNDNDYDDVILVLMLTVIT